MAKKGSENIREGFWLGARVELPVSYFAGGGAFCQPPEDDKKADRLYYDPSNAVFVESIFDDKEPTGTAANAWIREYQGLPPLP